jgi:cytochrome c oxidase subunit I+III
MLFVGIAFAALLLAYFYLRLENPQWPPLGVGDPPLARTLIAAGLVAASAGAVRLAQRRMATGDVRGFVRGLVVALALAGIGLAVQWFDLARLDLDWRAHAYGSIFYTVAGFVVVVTIAALIVLALTVFWTVRGVYTPRRHAPVANVVRFWMAMVGVWMIGFGTLYLGPYLT